MAIEKVKKSLVHWSKLLRLSDTIYEKLKWNTGLRYTRVYIPVYTWHKIWIHPPGWILESRSSALLRYPVPTRYWYNRATSFDVIKKVVLDISRHHRKFIWHMAVTCDPPCLSMKFSIDEYNIYSGVYKLYTPVYNIWSKTNHFVTYNILLIISS